MARRKFLTAQWRNLILANFEVPERLLLPHLPPGCTLDRRDGACWASVVAFQFLDTRVLGIGWPGFRDFPEWNLRFYVTHEGQRGVCFIREFVPRWLVATIARVLYNEPYRSARMTMSVTEQADAVTASYSVKWANRIHTITTTGTLPADRPSANSLEHWFKEHAWGFGTGRWGKLIRYEVSHPEWEVFPIRSFNMNIDWSVLYGPEWGLMNGVQATSVCFAAGSEVAVFPKG